MGLASLSENHRKELEENSGIDPDIIEARGYETIDRGNRSTEQESSRLRALGFSKAVCDYRNAGNWPALWIPSYRPSGEFSGSGQIKPRLPRKTPKGKDRKYESPTGKPAILDVHPMHRDRVLDPTVELWITEGIKKADSLTSRLRDSAVVVGLSGVWNWRSKVTTLGEWDNIVIRGREVTICFDADVRSNALIAEAMRRLGSWLRSKGATKVWYVAPPEEYGGRPSKGADDFFVAGGTIEELKALRQSRPLTVVADDSSTDRSLAQQIMLSEEFGYVHYTSAMGWVAWDGAVWAQVDEEVIIGRIGVWMDEQLKDAIDRARKGKGDDIKEWMAIRSAGRARAICFWLRTLLHISASEFDTDPDLLNCPNGVIDLKSGELLDHAPERMMTKCTGVDYLAEAESTDWDRVLECLPSETVPWFQIRMGQAITGHMDPTARLLILKSGGDSGKSTVIAALRSAMGTYGILMDDKVLITRDHGNHGSGAATPELMMLRGARFGYIEETPEGVQINENRMKKIIGTPEITARSLYKEPVSFKNSVTTMMSTNYELRVARSDRGTWRRLALLEFPYTFKSASEMTGRPDERLKDLALFERAINSPEVHQAALAWMVRGAVRYYERPEALNELPEVVLKATEVWRSNVDHVTRFLEERLCLDDGYWTPVAEVRAAFNSMAEEEGIRPLGQAEFSRRLLGLESIKTAGVVVELGRPSYIAGEYGEYGGRVGVPPTNDKIRVFTGVRLS